MSPTLQPQSEESARLEVNLAFAALEKGDREAARSHFHTAVTRLIDTGHSESSSLLITATLELSKLNFIGGKGFIEAIPFLQASLKTAQFLGDLRSMAMIKLHLGRHYFFAGKRKKATAFFQEGKDEVEGLGDDDIRDSAAELIGFYYYLQGRFAEALAYFEVAVERLETTRGVLVPSLSAPVWLGYCAAYLGQFNRAIGTLDYYRRILRERGDRTLAAVTQALLGIILLEIRKNSEAVTHLKGAIDEAEKTGNVMALYFATGGMALYYFIDGNMEACRRCAADTLQIGQDAGMFRQYITPNFLEIGSAFIRAGESFLPGKDDLIEIDRILNGPNVHLKGVLLRLVAEYRLSLDDSFDPEKDFLASKQYLKESGDPIQLAKTRFALTRSYLKQEDFINARVEARKAWKELAGYEETFFPKDLLYLLATEPGVEPALETKEEVLLRFIDIITELMPVPSPHRLLTRLVQSTNRFFGAERGALFWFSDTTKKPPMVRAACNLTETDAFSEGFRSNLALIFDAYRENRPILIHGAHKSQEPYKEKAILCLPFQIQDRTRGVLYHDNAYVTDRFSSLDQIQLRRLIYALSSYIEHVCGLSRGVEKFSSETTVSRGTARAADIIGESDKIKAILSKIAQVAPVDSNILILGETGVGKELIARRIHEKSNRREGPMVVVDPTAIPESLVESELFGHEKGAFTGADSRKKGLLELAHKGTLFIDEVGDIPKQVQVKLLRVLQEKTTMRVGGIKSILTDFRLVCATNRDLAEEVAAGRFREDLYYRLNVIPVKVPALRERKEDIIPLAVYFLKRYAIRHNRPVPTMSPEVETKLLTYHWPGNVRELENMIERGMLLSKGEVLELDLPSSDSHHTADPFFDLPTLDEVQRRYIQHVLEKTGGRVGGPGGSAEILGLKRTTLYSKMKRLDIRS